MPFAWDDDKAAANERKHGVTFPEAQTVFDDPLATSTFDPDHSQNEDRYVTIGYSSAQRLLFVAHVFRDAQIRVISARQATRREQKIYEETS